MHGLEKMKQGEKIKNYCNNCHTDTFHTVCAVKETGGCEQYSDYEISWWKNYGILECDGCKTVVFKTEEACSVDDDVDGEHITEEFFPPYDKDLGNAEEIIYNDNIPEEIKHIFQETVSSISNKCYILAGIGLRAIVESICKYENENKTIDNLFEKIKELVKEHIISEDDADKLHSIRLIGNDAVHDRKKPERDDIITAIKIIKNLLSNKYELKIDYKKTKTYP